MSKRAKRKLSLLLVYSMICVMLSGSTVFGAEGKLGCSGPNESGFDYFYYTPGDELTFEVPAWFNMDNFDRWQVIVRVPDYKNSFYKIDITSTFGLSSSELTQKSITLTMPDYKQTDEKAFGINVWFLNKSGTAVSSLLDNGWQNIPEVVEVINNSADKGITPEINNVSGITNMNVIRNSSGEVKTSAAAMLNEAYGLNGAVAVTPQSGVNGAAGLSEEDVANGTNAKLYIGDVYSRDEGAAVAKQALFDATHQLDKKLATVLNIDLYNITKKGEIESVRNIADGARPVQMTLGIPNYWLQVAKDFSLVYIDDNGKVIEVPDLDNDPKTITVDLTYFGKYALVYK